LNLVIFLFGQGIPCSNHRKTYQRLLFRLSWKTNINEKIKRERLRLHVFRIGRSNLLILSVRSKMYLQIIKTAHVRWSGQRSGPDSYRGWFGLDFFRNPGGLPICISEGVLWTRQKEYKVISE
jgi:hypothetical protein